MEALDYRTNTLTSRDPLDQWDAFVDSSPQGSIFVRSFWLEATAPGQFQILTLRCGDDIIAGWPMVIRSSRGRSDIGMPPGLTQVMGILLGESKKQTYEGRLSEAIDRISRLVELLPPFRQFSMNFHYNFTNWMPLYWAGFDQTTGYTYVIPDLSDIPKIIATFEHSKRKNIKKAERLVTVFEDMGAEQFYGHHVMTLEKQGQKIHYSFEYFARIFAACRANNAGKIFYAMDEAKHIHAAIFVIFDKLSAYYLISSIDPDFRGSGASTLLIKHALIYLAPRTRKFDFEGSMIPGVEHSFRKFGGTLMPIFRIRKDLRGFPEKLYDLARSTSARTLRKWRILP